ncbi:HAD family hydrolase [soil metagenome]
MTTIAAVLWDLDGTLVDTEPLWMKAEFQLAARHGAEWTHEDGLALVGRSLQSSGSYIKERMGLSDPVDTIVEELVAEMVAALGEGIPWRPGAVEMLEACVEAEIPMALVTMSYRIMTDAIEAALPVFDVIITGDEVSAPKPDPEPYLAAARALEVDPRDCVAFEDSPTGGTSAFAAGCTTIMLPNYAHVPETLGHAHWEGLEGHSIAEVQAIVDAVVRSSSVP